jgi:hypothetical protein
MAPALSSNRWLIELFRVRERKFWLRFKSKQMRLSCQRRRCIRRIDQACRYWQYRLR